MNKLISYIQKEYGTDKVTAKRICNKAISLAYIEDEGKLSFDSILIHVERLKDKEIKKSATNRYRNRHRPALRSIRDDRVRMDRRISNSSRKAKRSST